MDSGHAEPRVAELFRNGVSRRRVDPPLRPRQRTRRRAARCRRLPARDLLVSLEGVPVAKSVHAVQTRLPRLALVDLELLPVVALGRDQGAASYQAARIVAHRHLPRAAALGGRALQPNAPAPVVARGTCSPPPGAARTPPPGAAPSRRAGPSPAPASPDRARRCGPRSSRTRGW